MADVGACHTIDAQRHVGGALPCLSGMGVDGAHNTVGQMSVPTTLLGFCHARRVAGYPSDMPCWYYPIGVQGTVLGIAVDLSALSYFLHPFPGPHRAGVPGRLVLVGSDCASRRGAVSRGSAHSRSEKRVGVGSGFWPSLPVGEAVQRRARARSESCSSFVRPSGQRGGPESEAGTVSPRPGLLVGDWIVLLACHF